jgi:hypothetical protein
MTKSIKLTKEEMEIAIEALEMLYLRKVKKAQLHPRKPKYNENLRKCQMLTQRLMTLRNYEQDDLDAVTGFSTLPRETDEGTVMP